jgi:hypothetical protein
MSKMPVQKRPPRSEELIDETIDESFPASDPPSYSRTARSGAPVRGQRLDRVDCEPDQKASDEAAAATTKKDDRE